MAPAVSVVSTAGVGLGAVGVGIGLRTTVVVGFARWVVGREGRHCQLIDISGNNILNSCITYRNRSHKVC